MRTRSNEERKSKTDLALDLNELQEFSGEKLKALARIWICLSAPARSRHQHILDIVRAALTGGATVYRGRFPRPGRAIRSPCCAGRN